MKKTPLYETHLREGAKIVDFAGWAMPVLYSGINDEHRSVRAGAGIFDVSHMGRCYVRGRSAADFLQRLLPTDVSAMRYGSLKYAVMCNERGGAVDDCAVYRLDESVFLLIVNASRVAADLDWMRRLAGDDDDVAIDLSEDRAMLAIQGPEAEDIVAALVAEDVRKLSYFRCRQFDSDAGQILVSRSGYTGEDGFELICDGPVSRSLWTEARALGAVAAGLGARDTLRTEMGYCLYGHELDDHISPLEAGLAWTLPFDKEVDFCGRRALLAQREHASYRCLVGLRLLERGIPRPGCEVRHGDRIVGCISSGTFSPTLDGGIGLAFVESDTGAAGERLMVVIRDTPRLAEVASLPFVPSRVKNRKRTRKATP